MCYLAIQNLLYSPKNIRAKAYRNIILPVVLYGRANFLSRKEDNLRVFGFKVLRKTFGPKWKLQDTKENSVMSGCMVCIPHRMDTWQALLNAVINLQIPQNALNPWATSKSLRFSSWTLLRGPSSVSWNCPCANREGVWWSGSITPPILTVVEASWNVVPHAQKPDIFFRRNGRVHLNRRGLQFSRLLAAEVCASAVVMLDISCSEVVWRVLTTHSIRQFPLDFLSHASTCAITFQLESTLWWIALFATKTHCSHRIGGSDPLHWRKEEWPLPLQSIEP